MFQLGKSQRMNWRSFIPVVKGEEVAARKGHCLLHEMLFILEGTPCL